MGNKRKISISREITKKYEEIYRGTVESVIEELPDPKGEFVIVVSPSMDDDVDDNMSIVDRVNMYIRTGLTCMDAIKKVAKERKMPKNEVYKEYHGSDKE